MSDHETGSDDAHPLPEIVGRRSGGSNFGMLLAGCLLAVTAAYVLFASSAGDHPLSSYGFPFNLLSRTVAGVLLLTLSGGVTWQALVGLSTDPPRLAVSREGVLHHPSGGPKRIIPWTDVVDVRTRGRWGLDLLLRDPDAARARRSLWARLRFLLPGRDRNALRLSVVGLDVTREGIVGAIDAHLDRIEASPSPPATLTPPSTPREAPE